MKHPIVLSLLVFAFTTLHFGAVHSEPKRLWIQQDPELKGKRADEVSPYIQQSPKSKKTNQDRAYFNRYHTNPNANRGRVDRAPVVDRSISSNVNRGVLSARLRRDVEIPKNWAFLSNATYKKKLTRTERTLEKEYQLRKRQYYKSLDRQKKIAELSAQSEKEHKERVKEYRKNNSKAAPRARTNGYANSFARNTSSTRSESFEPTVKKSSNSARQPVVNEEKIQNRTRFYNSSR